MPFKKGHITWNKGKKMSLESRIKLSNSSKRKKAPWVSESNKRRKGIPKTEETKRKMSLSSLGKLKSLKARLNMSLASRENQSKDKHWNWKRGINPKNDSIRKSKEYKLWRKAVFERDNYTCIWCKVKNGNGKAIKLNADHIKPFAYYPALRFAIDNGRTLCVPCHKKTDTFGSKAYKYLEYNAELN